MFFGKSVNQLRQGNGNFPSVRGPSMSNATSCEVAAFDAMASPLFIYQLAASCSNACLQCQGLLWQERRHRHIWWHRNDNCFVFEDRSPFAFSLTFTTHDHVEDWSPAGGVSLCGVGS